MKNLLFTLAILLITVILIDATQLATAQDSSETSLPNWIKKNAKWWSEGAVQDKDFVQGIQYLIQKGIVKIPPTQSSDEQSDQKIPQWIKNNAGWWADGKISDGDFVSGIQYLISKGIMKINPPPKVTKPPPSGY
ncbi:MAG: hypothetical protein ACT4N5_07205 [Nitrosopumilaceae archaeon]